MEEHGEMFDNRLLRRNSDLRSQKTRETGDYLMKNFVICIYYGDKDKEDEMGRSCSTHGRDEKCIQYFGWKT